MKESYLKILELLKESSEKIVLVTIPPIQLMADSVQHWKRFTEFNSFILELHNGKLFLYCCLLKVMSTYFILFR